MWFKRYIVGQYVGRVYTWGVYFHESVQDFRNFCETSKEVPLLGTKVDPLILGMDMSMI